MLEAAQAWTPVDYGPPSAYADDFMGEVFERHILSMYDEEWRGMPIRRKALVVAEQLHERCSYGERFNDDFLNYTRRVAEFPLLAAWTLAQITDDLCGLHEAICGPRDFDEDADA